MRDISGILKEVYNADAVALVPGGGTYAMEAVARQFATGQKAIVIRNGWFSYRWTQIFEAGSVTSEETVLKARRKGNEPQAPFAPAPIEEVVARIKAEAPAVVFAPHVETSSGMILPDDYLKAVGYAVHSVGGLFVLDCIASGCIWVDMKAVGVDVLISAPQKGWSASPSAGLVMMNKAAKARVEATNSTSFAIDLKKWLSIMQAYEAGGHAYHATMPTDALKVFRNIMLETKEYGFDKLRDAQWELVPKCANCWRHAAFGRLPQMGLAPPAWLSAIPKIPAFRMAASLPPKGYRLPPGFRCNAMKVRNTKASGLGCSGLIS